MQSTTATVETSPNNMTFEDADLWYGESMLNVDWPEVFKEITPYVSYKDRMTLLEVAGKYGVSPALLLSATVNYKKEKNRSFQSHMEYVSAQFISYFFISSNRTFNQRKKENDATHAISLFVDKDLKRMDEFISILSVIKKEAFKLQKKTPIPSSDYARTKRGEGEETYLRFPFKMSECWMLSATHHSNEQCSAKSCPKSSIDLAPNLFMGFGHNFGYFNSQGEVVASHSGYVFVHSPCKLQVKSKAFTTFYSHIIVERTSGEYVRVGERLGAIQIHSELANCNCEVKAGNTECSTGPHLHWEVRDLTNKPMDLDGMIISGFKIFTGRESYDFGCGPENCHNNMTLDEIERSCSTVFLRLEDNTTFCPSVQGANWGKTLTFTRRTMMAIEKSKKYALQINFYYYFPK